MLVWSFGDFERHFSIQRVKEYLIGLPLFVIILLPSMALYALLPQLSRKSKTLVNEIATGIILVTFVVTMALCAITVYSIASTTALCGFFYFLGIGIQIILLALLAFISTRTKNA